MKEGYESLDVDVIEFEVEDVITTSGCPVFIPCENEGEMGG